MAYILRTYSLCWNFGRVNWGLCLKKAGRTEEQLLTKLANVEALRVISRTSVLTYKDTEKNIRAIENALNVTELL